MINGLNLLARYHLGSVILNLFQIFFCALVTKNYKQPIKNWRREFFKLNLYI